jgi:transposase
MRSSALLDVNSGRSITGCIAISITIAWPTFTMHHGLERLRTAAQITKAHILRELARNPLKLGYNTTIWTVPLLASHLSERFDAQITPRTLRRKMKEVGLRWKRPRYVYVTKDPNRDQKKGRSSDV